MIFVRLQWTAQPFHLDPPHAVRGFRVTLLIGTRGQPHALLRRDARRRLGRMGPKIVPNFQRHPVQFHQIP